MVDAFIGIGSNQQRPVDQVKNAIAALGDQPLIQVQACSSLYRSAPVGGVEQPDFINAVCQVQTSLSPQALLHELQQLEMQAGRVRDGVRWGPRTLDLDLLLYGDQTLETGTLVIPHSRMHERAFVLYPLSEISPNLGIPGHGKISELVKQCGGQQCARIETRDS